ncbi:unnamed protein product, partial [Onchocerca ochengi]
VPVVVEMNAHMPASSFCASYQ